MNKVRVNWNRLKARLPDQEMTTIAVPKVLLPNIKTYLDMLSKEGKGFTVQEIMETLDISQVLVEKEDPRQLRLF